MYVLYCTATEPAGMRQGASRCPLDHVHPERFPSGSKPGLKSLPHMSKAPPVCNVSFTGCITLILNSVYQFSACYFQSNSDNVYVFTI